MDVVDSHDGQKRVCFTCGDAGKVFAEEAG
jgi:hypothetical protein